MTVRFDIRLALVVAAVVFAAGYWVASRPADSREARPLTPDHSRSAPAPRLRSMSQPPVNEPDVTNLGRASTKEPTGKGQPSDRRNTLPASPSEVSAYERDLWSQLDQAGLFPNQLAALLRKIGELGTPYSRDRLYALFASGDHLKRPLQTVWAEVFAGINDPGVLPLVRTFLEARLKSGDSRGGDASGLWRVALTRMDTEERSQVIHEVLTDSSLGSDSLLRAEVLNGISGAMSAEAVEAIADNLSSPNMATHAFTALAASDSPRAFELALAHLIDSGHQAANVAPKLGPRLTSESAERLRDAALRDSRVSPSYLAAMSKAPPAVFRQESEHFRSQMLAVAGSKESAVPYGRARAAKALLAVADQVATEQFVSDLSELVDVSVQGRSAMVRALQRMREVLDGAK